MNTLKNKIFTVVFFGKTGAGKSSTLNKMFGLALNTYEAMACTYMPLHFVSNNLIKVKKI